jgi:hypothetical protein
MLGLIEFTHMFDRRVALFGECFDGLLLLSWITGAVSQNGHDPSRIFTGYSGDSFDGANVSRSVIAAG